jgi:CRISPR/Cas system-associated exonuclease Cas4 (RecB family)
MNPVESVLLDNIDKPNSCFIFPTEVAASRWADHLLRLKAGCGNSTVAMNKFIAWDVFKQTSIRSKVQNKKSIPSALRKIFVNRLVSENAQAVEQNKTPLFSSLIRPQWAYQSMQFSPWLTRVLPQLGTWFKKTTGLAVSGILGKDAEKISDKLQGDDKDLFVLALCYAQFLEVYGLFEPAWETPPFNDEGKDCFIFFPESLYDYSEYSELLAASGRVKTISALNAANQPCDSFFYTNSRSEITEAALYIRALHEKQGIKWDAIAVCIPDPENYEPYILREFTNRDIPFVKRTSKPLTSYSAGQFFLSVIDCTSQDFAFSAISRLVLNRNLPWKDTAHIHNLIEFGIKNNCISSWTEIKDGKEQVINVWEDAFKQPFEWLDPDARQFFRLLKQRLHTMRAASSFSELRRQYFIFREYFFDMEKCSEETDLILSRCISELTYLSEIEKDYSDVPAVDPFLFFTEYLSEVNYLAQTKNCGVMIFPYKTAASAPFDCHIVLGAGQDSLSVVFSGLDFLPRKKREKLGITDEDASGTFIDLHMLNSFKTAAFFCSEHTFSGFSIAHSKIGAPSEPRERYASVPELREKFCEDYYKNESNHEISTRAFLYKNQKYGFEKWKTRRLFDHLTDNGGNEWLVGKKLQDLIQKKYSGNPQFPGKYSVSASSLAPYFQCSLKWLFERVLEIKNRQIEANLMAEDITGMVYHAALNLFFSKLKNLGETIKKPISAEQMFFLPDDYLTLINGCIDEIFSDFPALAHNSREKTEQEKKKPQMSALTSRLLRAGKKQFKVNLKNFLVSFISHFGGYRVAGSETSYNSERSFYYLNGKVDCILEYPAEDKQTAKSKYVIIDFKLKSLPERDNCTGDGEKGLSDFQLPMYIILAQENEKIKIHTALFYSILKLKPEVIIGTVQDIDSKNTIPKDEDQILYESEKYRQIINEFIQKSEQFADKIAKGKMTVFESKYSECNSCNYNRICRTTYIIKREKNISHGSNYER